MIVEPTVADTAPADVEVVTLGCRLNLYESEAMRQHAQMAGLTDTIIINTCAVTAEAERQGRQTIRRLRRQRPSANIIVTGCSAQIDPSRYAAMAEVDRVVGNADKLLPATFARGDHPRVTVSDIADVRDTATHLLDGFDGRARAFVQVQQGCNHRCTFCVIPLGRGNARSVPAGDVVSQTRNLVEAGVREVVLTGVDLTSWGDDLPGRPSLGRLTGQILNLVPGLLRLRLSSLDPAEVDEDLWALMAGQPRLMPHLHLSVQAGNDLILRRMKRRHRRSDVLATIKRARSVRPDIAIGADLIAGFPTETEAAFMDTLSLIEEADVPFTHVFVYSPRPQTPAARMPQTPLLIARARAAQLRAAGSQALTRFLCGRVGHRESILVEAPGTGRTSHYARARIDPSHPPGTIIEVVVTGALDGWLLTGAAPC